MGTGGRDAGASTDVAKDGAGANKVPAAVQMVFTKYCSTPGCHGGGWATAALSYTRIMGMAAAPCAMPRMKMGDGAGSLVVKKMLGTAGCGMKMPNITPGVPCMGATCATMADIMTVQDWITMGAKPE